MSNADDDSVADGSCVRRTLRSYLSTPSRRYSLHRVACSSRCTVNRRRFDPLQRSALFRSRG